MSSPAARSAKSGAVLFRINLIVSSTKEFSYFPRNYCRGIRHNRIFFLRRYINYIYSTGPIRQEVDSIYLPRVKR